MSNLDIVNSLLLPGAMAIAALLDQKDATIAALQAQIPVPVPPTPTPVPPPSGQVIIPQNMSFTNGRYVSNNLAGTGIAVALVRLNSPVPLGRTAVFSFTRKTNVAQNGNLNVKIMRVGSGNYNDPNDYIGRSLNTGAEQFTTEHTTNGPSGNGTLGYFTFPISIGQDQTESYEFTYGSGKTGHVRVLVNGKVVAEYSNWDCGAANRTEFHAQCVIANATPPTGSYVEFANPLVTIR